jgi:hypothetical protein
MGDRPLGLFWAAARTTVTVDSCRFPRTSAGLELRSHVQRAIITGNSFEAGGIVSL